MKSKVLWKRNLLQSQRRFLPRKLKLLSKVSCSHSALISCPLNCGNLVIPLPWRWCQLRPFCSYELPYSVETRLEDLRRRPLHGESKSVGRLAIFPSLGTRKPKHGRGMHKRDFNNFKNLPEKEWVKIYSDPNKNNNSPNNVFDIFDYILTSHVEKTLIPLKNCVQKGIRQNNFSINYGVNKSKCYVSSNEFKFSEKIDRWTEPVVNDSGSCGKYGTPVDKVMLKTHCRGVCNFADAKDPCEKDKGVESESQSKGCEEFEAKKDPCIQNRDKDQAADKPESREVAKKRYEELYRTVESNNTKGGFQHDKKKESEAKSSPKKSEELCSNPEPVKHGKGKSGELENILKRFPNKLEGRSETGEDFLANAVKLCAGGISETNKGGKTKSKTVGQFGDSKKDFKTKDPVKGIASDNPINNFEKDFKMHFGEICKLDDTKKESNKASQSEKSKKEYSLHQAIEVKKKDNNLKFSVSAKEVVSKGAQKEKNDLSTLENPQDCALIVHSKSRVQHRGGAYGEKKSNKETEKVTSVETQSEGVCQNVPSELIEANCVLCQTSESKKQPKSIAVESKKQVGAESRSSSSKNLRIKQDSKEPADHKKTKDCEQIISNSQNNKGEVNGKGKGIETQNKKISESPSKSNQSTGASQNGKCNNPVRDCSSIKSQKQGQIRKLCSALFREDQRKLYNQHFLDPQECELIAPINRHNETKLQSTRACDSFETEKYASQKNHSVNTCQSVQSKNQSEVRNKTERRNDFSAFQSNNKKNYNFNLQYFDARECELIISDRLKNNAKHQNTSIYANNSQHKNSCQVSSLNSQPAGTCRSTLSSNEIVESFGGSGCVKQSQGQNNSSDIVSSSLKSNLNPRFDYSESRECELVMADMKQREVNQQNIKKRNTSSSHQRNRERCGETSFVKLSQENCSAVQQSNNKQISTNDGYNYLDAKECELIFSEGKQLQTSLHVEKIRPKSLQKSCLQSSKKLRQEKPETCKSARSTNQVEKSRGGTVCMKKSASLENGNATKSKLINPKSCENASFGNAEAKECELVMSNKKQVDKASSTKSGNINSQKKKICKVFLIRESEGKCKSEELNNQLVGGSGGTSCIKHSQVLNDDSMMKSNDFKISQNPVTNSFDAQECELITSGDSQFKDKQLSGTKFILKSKQNKNSCSEPPLKKMSAKTYDCIQSNKSSAGSFEESACLKQSERPKYCSVTKSDDQQIYENTRVGNSLTRDCELTMSDKKKGERRKQSTSNCNTDNSHHENNCFSSSVINEPAVSCENTHFSNQVKESCRGAASETQSHKESTAIHSIFDNSENRHTQNSNFEFEECELAVSKNKPNDAKLQNTDRCTVAESQKKSICQGLSSKNQSFGDCQTIDTNKKHEEVRSPATSQSLKVCSFDESRKQIKQILESVMSSNFVENVWDNNKSNKREKNNTFSNCLEICNLENSQPENLKLKQSSENVNSQTDDINQMVTSVSQSIGTCSGQKSDETCVSKKYENMSDMVCPIAESKKQAQNIFQRSESTFTTGDGYQTLSAKNQFQENCFLNNQNNYLNYRNFPECVSVPSISQTVESHERYANNAVESPKKNVREVMSMKNQSTDSCRAVETNQHIEQDYRTHGTHAATETICPITEIKNQIEGIYLDKSKVLFRNVQVASEPTHWKKSSQNDLCGNEIFPCFDQVPQNDKRVLDKSEQNANTKVLPKEIRKDDCQYDSVHHTKKEILNILSNKNNSKESGEIGFGNEQFISKTDILHDLQVLSNGKQWQSVQKVVSLDQPITDNQELNIVEGPQESMNLQESTRMESSCPKGKHHSDELLDEVNQFVSPNEPSPGSHQSDKSMNELEGNCRAIKCDKQSGNVCLLVEWKK